MRDEFNGLSPLKVNVAPGRAEIIFGRGRAVFDGSLLPTELYADGIPLLAAPCGLRAAFGGVEAPVLGFEAYSAEVSEERVVLLLSGACGGAIINETIVAEPDGFMRFSMKVMPLWTYSGADTYWLSELDGERKRLDRLQLELPFDPQAAELMHLWPAGASSLVAEAKRSAMFAEDCTLPWKPYLWFGTERAGLGITFPSDEQFILKGSDWLRATRKDNAYTVTLSLLEATPDEWQCEQSWSSAYEPRCYDFALQLTPVRRKNAAELYECNRKYHIYRLKNDEGYCGKTVYAQVDAAYKAGVKYIVPHGDWSLVSNAAFPENEAAFAKLVDYCHKLGMKVLPYFGYEYSALYPDFGEHYNEYLNKNTEGKPVGGWQRSYAPYQRQYIVCLKGGYSEALLRQVEFTLDRFKVDGIYTDGTYVPWECANSEHGCGYTDADGKRHITYPVFELRDFVKRLYSLVHSFGGIVDTHQSGCMCANTLAFADSIFDGENIQELLRQGGSLGNAAMRAEYSGRALGLGATFVAYTDEKLTLRDILTLTLPHNLFPAARRIEDLEPLGALWSQWDEYQLDSAVPVAENALLRIREGNASIMESESGCFLVAGGRTVIEPKQALSLAVKSPETIIQCDKSPCTVDVPEGEVYIFSIEGR